MSATVELGEELGIVPQISISENFIGSKEKNPKNVEPEKIQLGNLPIGTTVRIPNDPLKCECGEVRCEDLDRPATSHVLAEFSSAEEVEAAMRQIATTQHGAQEVIVGAGAMDKDALTDAARRVFGGGYRNESLEQVSLVYTNADTPLDELLAAMVRLTAGTKIAVHHAHSVGNTDELMLEDPHSRDQVLASYEHPPSMHPSYSGDAVSFVVQYYRREALVGLIGRALGRYDAHKEVLVHDDSQSEHDEWIEALNNTRYYLVHSGNQHEVRGYNRLTRMAASDTVVLLQDDDAPPADPVFVQQAWSLFRQHPKLALIGGLTGQIQGGPDTGRYGKQRARHVRQIPLMDSSRQPFMFVTWVNMGPFIIKRSVFLKVGSFQESFSCRGDPGIGFDYELGIRLWQHGYQVGLTIQGFRYHVGKTRTGGTRSSTAMKKRRDMLESRNTAFIKLLYRGFYVNHAPDGANRSPRANAMSLNSVCRAAKLPTLANRQLRAARG
eukprot:CAMPEP_0118942270 /NCGR_PEP_ID=MMETSP1169-20130426/35837_1 /TAXON_ID=36882 /ORGANISM="Pyramimonas obovata, Strain CCMP722" /LENGTH=495 /DNA_ID=CAMNT_0006887263 /DNA_START=376 /DNA_END=1866 /DNA_ORIENTATION=-